jgi:hypothetical protein
VTSEDSFDVSNALQQVTVEVFSSSSPDCERASMGDLTTHFCAGVNGGGKGRVNVFDVIEPE